VAIQTGFDRQAEAGGFLAVYPNGWKRAWNAGRCCGRAARTGIDDVGFLTALLDELESRYPIDPSRIHATGISNGGMMAYRLASELGERFAAIAPVASAMVTDCREGRPVPVLHIHGTADRNAPYAGGVGSRSYSGFHYPSVDETLAPWRARNECRPAPETTNSSPDLRVDRWPGLADVVLHTIEGGGHSWPGGQRMSRFLDPPSEAVDATVTIWEFFAAHPRQP
jgi:polyhydroxybutyrate depolymerase